MPYTLWINFRTVASDYPHGFTLEATGDLEGKGIWSFAQDGLYVNLTYDWTIRAHKSIIKSLSFLLKPIFRANHVWTMRRGEESLKLRIDRRPSVRRGQVRTLKLGHYFSAPRFNSRSA